MFYPSFEEAVLSRASKGVSVDVARALAQRSVIKVESGYQWHYDKRLTRPTPVRFNRDQVINIIESINHDVLYLEATSDLKNKQANHLIDYFKKVKHVELEGSHYVHTENPEVVAGLIHDFSGVKTLVVNFARII